MFYYFENLEKNKIDRLLINCGFILHSLRNHFQGYIQIENPEILSADNLSGNLEGICRQIRQHLVSNSDLKPSIITCVKVINFLKKIFDNNHSMDKNFINEKQEILSKYINYLINSFDRIDQEVNRSIISVTNQLFHRKSETIVNLDEVINQYEEIINFENAIPEKSKEIKFDKPKTLNDYKFNLKVIGFNISNQSHNIQDSVNKYVGAEKLGEVANKIIQLAGDLENQGRAVVAEGTTKKPNDKKLLAGCLVCNKNLNLIKENINNVKNSSFEKEMFLEKVNNLSNSITDLNKLIEIELL